MDNSYRDVKCSALNTKGIQKGMGGGLISEFTDKYLNTEETQMFLGA